MKTAKRITALILCLSILLFSTVFTVSADEAAVAGDAPFRIHVTVNGDTSTARGFSWYTKADSPTNIELFCDGAPVEAEISVSYSKEWEGSYMHKLTVTNLTPATTYTYRVGSEKGWSDYGTFTTNGGADDNTVNFVAIADVQASNIENFTKGANALNAAFTMMPDADFYANMGDFTDDSTNEEWDMYDTAFAQLNLKNTIVPISGNHDGLGVENWFNNMFNLDTTESVQTSDGVNYSFDYGNAHFAVLNTNDILSISLAQLSWLKNDLNSTDKDWKIVMMHKSPYSLGKDAKWPDALYLQQSLTKVLDACDVDVVFSGHDHQYLRTKKIANNRLDDDGTVYILSGTAGAKRYEVRSFLANHFMPTKFIDALVIQKDGYGNYWNGTNWDCSADTNIGSCFNCISINGGRLEMNTYILADEKDADGNDVITKVDTMVLEKAVGQNKITFTGDNTTSELEYNLSIVPSFLCLAAYTFTTWLPKFLIMAPQLIYVVITEDTF